MRKIDKAREPREWTEYRNTPNVDYQSIPPLVESLLKEQGYICAYCMRRIPCRDRNSSEDHRVEHIKCRNRYPAFKLNYNNMVICCPGAISGNQSFHCDKSKEDEDISFSPLNGEVIESLSYRHDGVIRSSNPQWDEELNNVLNLNNEYLKENRKQVLDALIEVMKHTEVKARWLNQQLDKWSHKDEDGCYKPYCGVIEWYLKRKLKSI